MGSELQAKYQKLAQEYAKVRAQLDVLKTAIKDEQVKRAQMEELIREKNLALRKHVQENDSLAFRNQQLAKRVGLLQDELESPASKRKSKKKDVSANSSGGVGLDVHAEELAAKISENERLHSKLVEVTQKSERQVTSLKDKVTKLEQEVATHDAAIAELNRDHTQQVDRIESQRALLQAKLELCSSELVEAKEEIARISDQVATASTVDSRSAIFKDNVVGSYNMLNVGSVDKRVQSELHTALTEAVRVTGDFTTQLSTFHSYLEQRCKLYPLDTSRGLQMSPVNQKLCDFLHSSSSYTRALFKSLNGFCSSLETSWTGDVHLLQEFSSSYTNLSSYLQTVVSYLTLSLEAECKESVCGPQLAEANNELSRSLQQLTSILVTISDYIVFLCTGDLVAARVDCRSSLMERLRNACTDLQEALVAVSNVFSSKVTHEYKLPTATQKLKTTNECIASALSSLTSTSQTMLEYLAHHSDSLCTAMSEGGYSGATPGATDTSASVLQHLRKRASNYVQRLQMEPCQLVPYSLAVYNTKSLADSSEGREMLTKQVAGMQERLTKAEQEKEQYSVDLQLLKVKYEKEQKKVAHLESEMSQIRGITPPASLSQGQFSTPLSTSRSSLASNPQVTSLSASMGSINTLPSEEQAEEVAREELIRNHFSTRIAELNSQLQETDCKATFFYSQCVALHKQLVHLNTARNNMTQELQTATENVNLLQDQLATTSSNYESQLSTMSDHLCEISDKLVKQEEEMEILRRGKPQTKRWGKRTE